MRSLSAVTMVPHNKASTSSSSKRETRGATDLLHMGSEAPKGLISKEIFLNITGLFCLASLGTDHDASCTRYFHSQKHTHRVSHEALQQDIQPSAARAAPTPPTGFPACLPSPCSSVTAWTTWHSGANFSCTGSTAVPWMWTWSGCHGLLQHTVLQAAKPLQGLITSNYNILQTWNVLGEFGTVFYVALDWLRQTPSAEQLLRHVHQQKRSSPISKTQPILHEHKSAAERTTFHQEETDQVLLLPLPALAEPQGDREFCGRAMSVETFGWELGDHRIVWIGR